jgi:hypothetical protein
MKNVDHSALIRTSGENLTSRGKSEMSGSNVERANACSPSRHFDIYEVMALVFEHINCSEPTETDSEGIRQCGYVMKAVAAA